jgi:hypothetical protein
MLGFALSTTAAAAGVVYLARQRKHLSLSACVMVFSVIFLISWSGFSWLADTHKHTQPKRGEGKRIIRKKTRPKYMRVQYVCSRILFILLLFQLIFFLCPFSLESLSKLPIPFYSLSIVPKLDLFQMIYSFRFAISYAATVLRSFQKAIHFAAPYIHVVRKRETFIYFENQII